MGRTKGALNKIRCLKCRQVLLTADELEQLCPRGDTHKVNEKYKLRLGGLEHGISTESTNEMPSIRMQKLCLGNTILRQSPRNRDVLRGSRRISLTDTEGQRTIHEIGRIYRFSERIGKLKEIIGKRHLFLLSDGTWDATDDPNSIREASNTEREKFERKLEITSRLLRSIPLKRGRGIKEKEVED